MHAEAARPPLARAARLAAIVVAVDAATKALAATHLAARDVAVAGPLSLSLTYNDTFGRGVDLGTLTAPATFALTLAFVALAAVVCTALARVDDRAPRALGLVAGAALANAADFAYTGRGAVDFLAVATRDGAVVFNLADVAAYAGVLLLLGTTASLVRAIAAERRAERTAHLRRVAAAERVASAAARARRSEIVRPVPLFAEPSARVRPVRDDADVPAVYPPTYPYLPPLPADLVVDVAPPLGLER